MRVTRARSPLCCSYTLKGITLSTETTTKYLGVDLHSELSWKTHIDRVTKKANNMLGFLRRNLQNTSRETKTRAYISLVRSNLEYCATIWSPHHKTMIRKVEMVQRRAARFTTNRYHNTSSVTDMLEELKWESLESRRHKHQLTMLFRIIHHLVDIKAEDYLHPAKILPRSNHNIKFLPYSTSSDSYTFSFFPRSIPLWNALPATAAVSHSLASFK